MSNGKTYLGVDIGGTSVKLGLVDEQGVIRYSEAYDVAFDRYETPILKKYEIVSCGTRGDGTGAGGNWCVGYRRH